MVICILLMIHCKKDNQAIQNRRLNTQQIKPTGEQLRYKPSEERLRVLTESHASAVIQHHSVRDPMVHSLDVNKYRREGTTKCSNPRQSKQTDLTE